ncbi:hypothetical protein D3C74_298260 [compost metagenome]
MTRLRLHQEMLDFVLDDIFSQRVRTESQLIAEHVVLSVPDEQLDAVRRFPPERGLLAAERVHAVMRVDTGK